MAASNEDLGTGQNPRRSTVGVDVAAYVFDGTYTAEEALTKVRGAEETVEKIRRAPSQ